MSAKFYFSFADHWRAAPLAYWVHLPVADQPGDWQAPLPPCIPHKGYAYLHVEFEKHELIFSSPAQLAHFIEALSKTALPTTLHLSSLRGAPVGPNGHWLSRLPASLKAPRKRAKLVIAMRAVQTVVVNAELPHQFAWEKHLM
ncbi:hypothetical protein ACO0LF_28400 [Undibacterium sp. Di27W]|uniref:hypothetical protein n=1 Tax=Undibacterium sp. Di27W TaxID=3413036 RepID=UPI003BF25130